MARLVFAPSAIIDTREILATLVEKAGRQVAAAYFDRFRSTFDRIAAFPSSGAPRPHLGVSVRIAVVRPYVVIYRQSLGIAEVMRVVHGRRNITRQILTKN